MAAPMVLGTLNLYNLNEARLARAYAKKYAHTPLPAAPAHLPGDVSVIIPTISTEDSFAEYLGLWLENEPKEVIIVTIPRDLARVTQLVGTICGPKSKKIRVITVDQPNKREQLVAAIKVATGSILALVDDDTFPKTEKTLPHLLAPFEDPQVGATGGPQLPYVPAERENEATITIWEAACIRGFHAAFGSMAPRIAADGGVLCLVGRTILVRSNIVQNHEFYSAFTSELWRGQLLNTGDDVFITRWIQLLQGWKIGYQDVQEAAVKTTIKQDVSYFYQTIRWKRSSAQMMITNLFINPGFWALRERYPYMARKLAEKLVRPTLTWVNMVAWFFTLGTHPKFALLVLAYHLVEYYKSYRSYLRANPHCRRQLLGVIVFDHVPLLIEPYIWLTINNDSWMTRDDSTTQD